MTAILLLNRKEKTLVFFKDLTEIKINMILWQDERRSLENNQFA